MVASFPSGAAGYRALEAPQLGQADVGRQVRVPPRPSTLCTPAHSPPYGFAEYYAPWCPVCQGLSEPLAAAVSDPWVRERFAVYQANVDQMQELAKEEGIRSIPRLVIYSPTQASPRSTEGWVVGTTASF